jgi:hypothetical protein
VKFLLAAVLVFSISVQAENGEDYENQPTPTPSNEVGRTSNTATNTTSNSLRDNHKSETKKNLIIIGTETAIGGTLVLTCCNPNPHPNPFCKVACTVGKTALTAAAFQAMSFLSSRSSNEELISDNNLPDLSSSPFDTSQATPTPPLEV